VSEAGTTGTEPGTGPALDLYWIPLGAGTGVGPRVVRASGRAYEAIAARRERRVRTALYHAALVAGTPLGPCTVEVAPVPDDDGATTRGVVGTGPVGSRLLGRFRVFRYEIRCWSGGVIPDLGAAAGEPVRLADDLDTVERVLDLLTLMPTPVWGRDELGAGEMWNSNSVIAWVLVGTDLLERAGRPPAGGRAPGWDAGVVTAHRSRSTRS
jgi:hypothetical protein